MPWGGGKSGAVWTELIQHPDGGLAPVVVFDYFLLSFLSLTRLLSTKVLWVRLRICFMRKTELVRNLAILSRAREKSQARGFLNLLRPNTQPPALRRPAVRWESGGTLGGPTAGLRVGQGRGETQGGSSQSAFPWLGWVNVPILGPAWSWGLGTQNFLVMCGHYILYNGYIGYNEGSAPRSILCHASPQEPQWPFPLFSLPY